MKTNSSVSPLYKLWLAIRGSLFWLMFLPTVLISAVLLSLTYYLPVSIRMGIIKVWITLNLWWIKLTCGLGYEVEGLENIPPDDGFIVMSKHSSTWETIALQKFFRPMVWVVKKELTYKSILLLKYH
jgi:1-acyl-sn-glycerol-3-phosphate acyltransferase